MGDESADRFLTCVIKRSENDLIIRVGALILIMLVVPLVAILILLDAIWVYNTYIADPTKVIDLPVFIFDHLDHFAGAHLMEYTVGTFLMYMIIKEYVDHEKRDLVWMDSLIDYAEYRGHDAGRMKEIRDNVRSKSARKVKKAFLIWFILVIVASACQALFISLRDMDPQSAVLVINVLIFEIMVQIIFTGAYLQRKTVKLTDLQCRFSEAFHESMRGDFPEMEPMRLEVKEIKLIYTIILNAVTLGVFGLFHLFWAVSELNLHIRTQWMYELALVRAVGKNEKVAGVEKVPPVDESRLQALIRRILS